MHDERPAREKMRRAVDALVTSPGSLRVRVARAEKPFGELDPDSELPSDGEEALYHRIASTIVSGGDEADEDDCEDESYDEAAAIAESIAALDEERLILIARDMLRLYELAGSPPDLTGRWPPDWPAT